MTTWLTTISRPDYDDTTTRQRLDNDFKTTTRGKVKEMLADGTEIEVEKDLVVNRTDKIAHVGSAALDNEECYLLQKLVRSWGLVHVEHQARI